MRAFLLENFTTQDFDMSDPEQVEALISYAKEHCSKAISEFYASGNYLHRGISGINGDHAYAIPTKESRTPFGTATKGKTGASFNGWLARNGHVRRDKTVAFATTSTPAHYNGIRNDEWFYFIPVGDYHYTYINSVQGGDFNLHSWVQKSLGSFQYFEEMMDALEGAINHSNLLLKKIRRDNKDLDFDSFEHVNKIIDRFVAINQKSQKMILDVAMLYQKGIFSGDNLDNLYELKPYMEKLAFLEQDYENAHEMLQKKVRDGLDPYSDEYSIISMYEFSQALEGPWEYVDTMTSNIHVQDAYKMIEALMMAFVTDKITPHFEDNEVFVQCSSYLVIPYRMGNDFIKKLLG